MTDHTNLTNYLSKAKITFGFLLNYWREQIPQQQPLVDQAEAQLTHLLETLPQAIAYVAAAEIWELRMQLQTSQQNNEALITKIQQQQQTLTTEQQKYKSLQTIAQKVRSELVNSVERERELREQTAQLKVEPAVNLELVVAQRIAKIETQQAQLQTEFALLQVTVQRLQQDNKLKSAKVRDLLSEAGIDLEGISSHGA